MSGNSIAYQEALREGNALSWELKWQAAVERYKVAAAEFPEDPVALNSLAMAYLRCGQLGEALAQYEAILRLTPDDESALSRIAEIQQRQGDVGGATQAYLLLADHHFRNGQRDKSVQTWLQLGALFPDSLETQERLYRAMSQAGETTLAGKVGLQITRLRGEKAGKGLDPWGQPPVTLGEATRVAAAAPQKTFDPSRRAAGLQKLDAARGLHLAGQAGAALLEYIAAAAALQDAGAEDEAAEVDQLASALASQYGGVRISEMVTLDAATRPIVLEKMAASRANIDGGRHLAAIDDCMIGICGAPDFLPLHERLAEAQAAESAPELAVARLISVGEVYVLRGDKEQAARALAKASQIGVGDREAWEQLILALLRAGLADEAVRQILASSIHLLEHGEAAAAVRQLARAVQVRPDDPAVLVPFGRALEADGQWLPALQAYDQALQAANDVDTALRLAVVAGKAASADAIVTALAVLVEGLADGTAKPAKMLAYLAAESAHQPENPAIALCQAVVSAQQGDWTYALPELERAAARDGLVEAIARLWLGRAALAAGNSEDGIANAVRQLVRVQKLLKERRSTERGWRWIAIESHRLWAELSVSRGELDKAVAALAEVRRLAPRDKRVCIQLAEVHFRRSDPTAALAEVVALGDLHRTAGQTERALLVYQGAIHLAPGNPTPRHRVIEAQLALGRLAEAFDTASDLAEEFAKQGHTDTAAETLRELIPHCREIDPAMVLALREKIARLLPSEFDARQQLIANYLTSGQADAALQEATRLSRDMLAAGRLTEAAKALQQALQVDPWNAETLASMGDLYERAGEYGKAIASYKRAVTADPQNRVSLARLALLKDPQIH